MVVTFALVGVQLKVMSCVLLAGMACPVVSVPMTSSPMV